MSRCGALVLEDVYGMSNVEDGVPLQPDAIFRLMSMSKPITAAAAMICYEAGYYQCAALPPPILSLAVFELTALLLQDGRPAVDVPAGVGRDEGLRGRHRG